ncbi:flavin reductase family protein [Rhodobaculum claviforme]|uniref:Flavin reductase n=1 Tax=Rhodobaculum claviforme TaxID=1549854 RepID=A0A934TIF4_9RHOB|nr:flavin reductase family protein [Rhodobaculum claviforme]MBK5925812.1 flavin reductase [Rhodobaculum claviforme]
MDVDFTRADAAERYRWLTNFVGPRPIALVSTRGPDAIHNAAPMSFFNVVSHEPPLLVLGIQPREPGRDKDTVANIRATGDFTVNMVDMALAPGMLLCGLDPGPGVDEIALAGLTAVPGTRVAAPRIGESPCAFECRLERIIDYPRRAVILGEVVHMHVHDSCLDAAGRYVDPARYQPVARLHADSYIAARDQFVLRDPPLEALMAGPGGRP